MKLRKIAALLAGVALMSSCEYQKYNRIEQIDLRSGNEVVYGVHPDSAARQRSIQYQDNPEVEKRVSAIWEKLYGSNATVAVKQ